LVLVPVERVFSDVQALLVVQAVVLAVAVVPLYATARRLGLSQMVAGAFVAAYVLSLGVAQAVSFDFHVEVFAPFFAFTALWALASPLERNPFPPRRQPGGFAYRLLFAMMLVLILTLKEDGALLAIALCWVGWFAFRERWAIPMAVVAVLYMVAVSTAVIPYLRGDDLNPFVERYGYLGDSPMGVAWGALTNPHVVFEQLTRADALKAMVVVLASAAFLPLLAPRLLPALALVTLLPLLSQDPGQGALSLHYLLVPSIVATAMGLVVARDLGARGKGQGARFNGDLRVPVFALGAALVLLPLALYAWRSPLPLSFEADMGRFEVDDHARLAQDFVNGIPPHASVSAQSPFVPHLSARTKLFQFPRLAESFYVLLDMRAPVPQEDRNAGFARCVEALPSLGYVIVREEDGIQLWRRLRDPSPLVGVPDPCGGLRSWASTAMLQ
jgi:hypothetical protein